MRRTTAVVDFDTARIVRYGVNGVKVLEVDMEVLKWFLVSAIGGLALMALLVFVLAFWLRGHAFRLLYDLPWQTWLTLDDLTLRGHSELAARINLPVFHKAGLLELRPLDASEDVQEDKRDFDFLPETVQYFTFKLVRRPPRRDKKRKWSFFHENDPLAA